MLEVLLLENSIKTKFTGNRRLIIRRKNRIIEGRTCLDILTRENNPCLADITVPVVSYTMSSFDVKK
jgi:hypothetical protein